MKYVFAPFLIASLMIVGVGCQAPAKSTETPRPPVTVQTPAPTGSVKNLCSVAPTENEAGQRVYPIAPKYERLPHLGQIFTALDCNDPKRATSVSGFTADGKYTAGILIRWKTGGASGQLREALRKLGFAESDRQSMRSAYPYSIDDLRTLRDLMNDPDAVQALETEDCISCG